MFFFSILKAIQDDDHLLNLPYSILLPYRLSPPSLYISLFNNLALSIFLISFFGSENTLPLCPLQILNLKKMLYFMCFYSSEYFEKGLETGHLRTKKNIEEFSFRFQKYNIITEEMLLKE